MDSTKRLGYWFSEKKAKRIALPDILAALRERNIEPVKINLDTPLEEQGPFDGILLKITEFVARTENRKAQLIVENMEQFCKNNPSIPVIDRIECLKTLMDRYKTYSMLNQCQILMNKETAFVPPFVALRTSEHEKNISLIKNSNVTFPVVCKPILSHGATSAHQMTLVFNPDGLKECQFPVIVQSFVNHDAILFKLFALENEFVVVERPSIRNLYESTDKPPIHFNGGEISKPNSCSQLTIQNEDDVRSKRSHKFNLPMHAFTTLVREIHHITGLNLFGVDVAIENGTGRLAVVDVNAFPGYEGVPDFHERLASLVKRKLQQANISNNCNNNLCESILHSKNLEEKNGLNESITKTRLMEEAFVS